MTDDVVHNMEKVLIALSHFNNLLLKQLLETGIFFRLILGMLATRQTLPTCLTKSGMDGGKGR